MSSRKGKETVEGTRLPISQAAPANQNATKTILHKKTEEWPPCLAYKLKHNNRANDWWFPLKKKKKVKRSNSAHS